MIIANDGRHALCKFLPIVLILLPSAVRAEKMTIDEIYVVAQRRTQSLQEVPVSVSVLSGQEMLDAGAQDLFDVARQVSSLEVYQNTGPINTSFRIRRIGNEANIPNFEPAVGLFVDGAFRTRSGVGIGDLFDIERIEVLRGPQSTLYGKNTTAGLVSIITKRPGKSFELFGELTAGRIDGNDTVDLHRLNAVVSGPVTDRLGARISGSYFDHGHTMTNLFANDDSQDMHRYALRGQLLYTPTAGLEAHLILGRFVIDSANTGEFEIDEGISIATINAGFGVPCPASTSTDRAFCNNRAAVVELEANDATLNLVYDLDGFTLTSISAYEDYDNLRDFDADQLNIALVDIFDRQDSESYSQELRVTSPSGDAMDWITGAYYYRNDFQRGDPVHPTVVLGPAAPLLELIPGTGIPFGQPGDAGFLRSRTESEHLSLFGQAVWHANDRLDLIGGARWQTEDKRSSIVNVANHSTPSLITLGLAPASGNAMLSRDTDGVSWNISGQYQWTDHLMTYFLISKGFKSGGFNAGFSPTPGASREFDDENVISYELGAKTMLLGNRLRLNASLFTAEYDDYQSAGFVSLRFRVNNAERVDVSGFELDAQAVLSEHIRGSVSVSYADANYGRYTGGSCYLDRVADNADGTACVLTGSTLPLAPKWKAGANLSYEYAITFGDFYARLDWTWIDDYHTNATLDPRHLQKSFNLVNLRSGLRFGKFDISAWVNNVSDETFVMQDGPSNLFATDPAFGRFLGAPRSYGVTVRAAW